MSVRRPVRADSMAREQRAASRELGCLRRHRHAVAVGTVEPQRVAEQLVFDPEQLAALGGEVPAPGETHRRAASGAVEGLGDRRPPVHHHRLLALVRHRQTPDVEGLACVAVVGRAIDAPEHEAGVAELELTEAGDDGVPDDVALEPGLLGAAAADFDHGAQSPPPGVGQLRDTRRRSRGTPARLRDRDGGPSSAVLVRGTDHATGCEGRVR